MPVPQGATGNRAKQSELRYCTWPYCDYDNISIHCGGLIIIIIIYKSNSMMFYTLHLSNICIVLLKTSEKRSALLGASGESFSTFYDVNRWSHRCFEVGVLVKVFLNLNPLIPDVWKCSREHHLVLVQFWFSSFLLITKRFYYFFSFGLLICQQDYTETTGQISMKLGWRIGLGPK